GLQADMRTASEGVSGEDSFSQAGVPPASPHPCPLPQGEREYPCYIEHTGTPQPLRKRGLSAFTETTMEYQNILFESAGGIARLTLNRPDKLNSFTLAMHQELRDALVRVKADPQVRVLVLTGAGRGFCAGQDLADLDGKLGEDELGTLVQDYY